ncbi:uncharacterized protein N0V89_011706 [Didymosphaeria variabile]|uniref:Protein kinase domain-containing protein n=1 Tax=Didymosphaeria variabile TaxID=1932322 RepID=A0A9W9C6N0_9PLEO|nr:uncharacterized protein N0V89_011706 [Didymosphaeria variabile]KAJ4345573.1 hypothetical protein N0V89_011706 [Didymosphaeria variabile]
MEQNLQDAACSGCEACLWGATLCSPTRGPPSEEAPSQTDMADTDDPATPEAFFTATPGYKSHLETPGRLNPDTEYGRTLQGQKLLVAKEVELNWSGRGQHVEFKENEYIPLEVEKTIGYSATALIESWIQKLRSKVLLPDKDVFGFQWDPLPPPSLLLDLLGDMIAEDPKNRPTAVEVATRLESVPSQTYRVAEEDEIHEAFKFSNYIEPVR